MLQLDLIFDGFFCPWEKHGLWQVIELFENALKDIGILVQNSVVCDQKLNSFKIVVTNKDHWNDTQDTQAVQNWLSNYLEKNTHLINLDFDPTADFAETPDKTNIAKAQFVDHFHLCLLHNRPLLQFTSQHVSDLKLVSKNEQHKHQIEIAIPSSYYEMQIEKFASRNCNLQQTRFGHWCEKLQSFDGVKIKLDVGHEFSPNDDLPPQLIYFFKQSLSDAGYIVEAHSPTILDFNDEDDTKYEYFLLRAAKSFDKNAIQSWFDRFLQENSFLTDVECDPVALCKDQGFDYKQNSVRDPAFIDYCHQKALLNSKTCLFSFTSFETGDTNVTWHQIFFCSGKDGFEATTRKKTKYQEYKERQAEEEEQERKKQKLEEQFLEDLFIDGMPNLAGEIPAKLYEKKEWVERFCAIPACIAKIDPVTLKNRYGSDLFPGITFLEGPHQYWLSDEVYNQLCDAQNKTTDYNGVQKWNRHCFSGSVTKVAGSCFSPFVAKDAIAGVLRSKNYNNPSYNYYNMSAVQIENKWLAANLLGTLLHFMIELHCNEHGAAIPKPLKDICWQQYLRFYRENVIGKWTPFLTELRVYDLEFDLAGSIDAVFVRNAELEQAKRENRKPKIILVDWKRTSQLSRQNFHRTMAQPPLEMLPDSNFYKYSMQLSLYRYLIHKNAGYEVEKSFLCRFNPNLGNEYELVETTYYKEQVEQLLQIRKAELAVANATK